jgi:hypothetical protein
LPVGRRDRDGPDAADVLQTLLEQNSHVPDVRARVGLAVAAIATHAATNGGAAGQAAAAGSVPVNEALKSAAEMIGNLGAGRAEVTRLGTLATATARDESESQALCSAARDTLQPGPLRRGGYAPHQPGEARRSKRCVWAEPERDTNARSVWVTLAAVARQLMMAWGEKWRKLCPAHLEASALVVAVIRGKVSVATLVPTGLAVAKSAKALAEQRDAMMQAWPVLMAVVREVTPRDTTAEAELLEIAVRAFNPTHAGAEPVENLVAPVFKEMTAKYGRYLVSGGIELRKWSSSRRRRRC